MSSTCKSPDLSAYKTACDILDADAAAQFERRSSPRFAFSVVQRIAPCIDKLPLSELPFFPVWCRDVSRGGVSLLLPDRIDFSTLIVELGTPPEVKWVEAEVVNGREVWYSPTSGMEFADDETPPPADGIPMRLVSCRFTERVVKE